MVGQWLETEARKPGWLNVGPAVPDQGVAGEFLFHEGGEILSHCKGWRPPADHAGNKW